MLNSHCTDLPWFLSQKAQAYLLISYSTIFSLPLSLQSIAPPSPNPLLDLIVGPEQDPQHFWRKAEKVANSCHMDFPRVLRKL